MLINRAIYIENEDVNLKKGAPETATNSVGLPTSILSRYRKISMSKLYFLISLLIIVSCSNREYIEVAKLPTIHEKYVLNDTLFTAVNSSTKYISKLIETQINLSYHFNSHYFALAKFDIPSMLAGKARSYDLALVNLKRDTTSFNILITVDTSSNRLMGAYMFDADICKLNAVYPVSNELNDVIAIEVIEDKYNPSRVGFLQHRLDVLDNGHIDYKHTVADQNLIFLGLNDICEHCGIYTSHYKEVSVKAEIRQGFKPKSLAYLLVVTSPTECSEHYRTFDGELLNGVMSVNDHLEMEFTQNHLSLKIKDYKNGCDEMQSGGNFILKRNQ
jgi:hypothetical protein